MITQTNPHIGARPATPPIQREPHVFLPRRSTQAPNMALAGLQLLVGYAWLLAGVDKLLLGAFPAQLVGLLRTTTVGGHLPGFFVAVFQGLVMRNAVLFGFLIERLAPLAATGAGLLGLSYFLLDGAPAPWFVPSIAFGGAINGGLFLAAASVVLIVSQFVQ